MCMIEMRKGTGRTTGYKVVEINLNKKNVESLHKYFIWQVGLNTAIEDPYCLKKEQCIFHAFTKKRDAKKYIEYLGWSFDLIRYEIIKVSFNRPFVRGIFEWKNPNHPLNGLTQIGGKICFWDGSYEK